MKYLTFSFVRVGVEACSVCKTSEVGGKWGTKYLNARFPLPILLCAGYNKKLKNKCN